jgi:hypothetical protein
MPAIHLIPGLPAALVAACFRDGEVLVLVDADQSIARVLDPPEHDLLALVGGRAAAARRWPSGPQGCRAGPPHPAPGRLVPAPRRPVGLMTHQPDTQVPLNRLRSCG